MKPYTYFFQLAFVSILCLTGCSKFTEIETGRIQETPYSTEKVIVLMIDGERYSETWNSQVDRIPNRRKMASEGVVNTKFKNEGLTKTISGHTAVSTGRYQRMENGGKEDPVHPSFLQLYLEASGEPSEKAWIITAKKKLEVLAETRHARWKNHEAPAANALERTDEEAFISALNILNQHEPDLILLNFAAPDKRAHENNWNGYLEGISTADSLIGELQSFIDEHPAYAGKTSLFITNDHGRHLDSKGGFKSHGCSCDGCTHITLEAYGPDFKNGERLSVQRGLIDIAPTVCELMGVELYTNHFQGTVMHELFK